MMAQSIAQQTELNDDVCRNRAGNKENGDTHQIVGPGNDYTTGSKERRPSPHDKHGCALTESCTHQAMVDVSLVCFVDRTMFTLSTHNGEKRIKDRNTRRQNRHQQRNEQGRPRYSKQGNDAQSKNPEAVRLNHP